MAADEEEAAVILGDEQPSSPAVMGTLRATSAGARRAIARSIQQAAANTSAATNTAAVTTGTARFGPGHFGATPAKKKIPWGPIILGLGMAGAAIAYFALRKKPKREVVTNPPPDDDDDDEEAAVRFYEKFHWGRRPRKRSRVRLAPDPRSLVKLGTLEAVTYSARKGAEKLADYIHHFGEGGTKKPTLAADPRSRNLHIVGGGYDVKEAGIVG